MQLPAYLGKLAIHPTAVGSLSELVERATIGPVPGWLVLAGGLVFHASWLALALGTLQVERRERRQGRGVSIA